MINLVHKECQTHSEIEAVMAQLANALGMELLHHGASHSVYAHNKSCGYCDSHGSWQCSKELGIRLSNSVAPICPTAVNRVNFSGLALGSGQALAHYPFVHTQRGIVRPDTITAYTPITASSPSCLWCCPL